MEKQKLLAKLPDWLISRWNREATREMKEQKRYPDFKTFTAFVPRWPACSWDDFLVFVYCLLTKDFLEKKYCVQITALIFKNILFCYYCCIMIIFSQ